MLKIALTNGTWLEGEPDAVLDLTSGTGIHLNDVHRASASSGVKGVNLLAKRVFIPYTAILFVILE